MATMNDRDHFAAAALSGLIAAKDNADMDEMVASSFAWADAMLAARATLAESSVVRDEYRGFVSGTYVRVMWAVFSDKSSDPQYESLCHASCVEWADKASSRSGEVLTVEPLYRSRTGTASPRSTVRLPREEPVDGPFSAGWNTAMKIVVSRLREAGVEWKVDPK
jgi:hypothetical protein